MKSYVFRVVVEEDAMENGEKAFHAFCPALTGCHTWGRTYDEALANVREAVELYVTGREQRRRHRRHEEDSQQRQRIPVRRRRTQWIPAATTHTESHWSKSRVKSISTFQSCRGTSKSVGWGGARIQP